MIMTINYDKIYADAEPKISKKPDAVKSLIQFPEGTDVKDMARAYTRLAVDTLATIVQSDEASDSNKITASTELLNRGWGKPAQALEVSRGHDDYSRMPLARLIELEQALLSKMPVVEGQCVEVDEKFNS